jgi:hypothetical protein
VKAATDTETGEKVAIKVLDKEKIQKQNMGAQVTLRTSEPNLRTHTLPNTGTRTPGMHS